MKRHLLFFAAILLLSFIASCHKQQDATSVNRGYLQQVKAALKDSLSSSDFTRLDYHKSVLSKNDSARLYVLRIPFQGKPITEDFILLKTDAAGHIQKGSLIHLEKHPTEYDTRNAKSQRWNGNVQINSLNRAQALYSDITNGYIGAFHKASSFNDQAKAQAMPDPTITLPEVVVVGSYSSGGGMSFASWISWASLLNDISIAGWYSPFDTFNGGGGGGGGTSGSDPGTPIDPIDPIPTTEDLYQVDFENQYANDAIDVVKYMKCFADIPDAGATCSIELFTDIPVDGDPNKLFEWNSGSPGHSFIQLKKTNGAQSVTQNIGFYPETGWKASITPAPVPGKFVDNGQHEFNASIKIELTPAQLQTAITRVLYLSHFVQYDIDDYNCTTWALDVFNESVAAGQRLEIPLLQFPGSENPNGSHTPQGLYMKLQSLKQAGGPIANNITTDILKGWVNHSKGPCL